MRSGARQLGWAVCCAWVLSGCAGGSEAGDRTAGPGADGGTSTDNPDEWSPDGGSSTEDPGDRDAGSAPSGPGGGSSPGPDRPLTPCERGECSSGSWCDADAWGGTVPDASTDVVVPEGLEIVVDCDAQARTVTVESGASLKASREQSAVLTVHGNLVVQGLLDYGKPDDRIPQDVTAELVFTGMNDADYQGTPSTEFGSDRGPSADTPMEVLESDIGLWVMGEGVFTAAGAVKKSWSFLTDGAAPGDRRIQVEDARGWRPGDRLLLTPTASRAETSDHYQQFDEITVASVDGTTIELEEDPSHTHAGCSDCYRRGEAANLTRNVVVRSADDGAHAHVMVAEQGLLQVDSAELRWLGPAEECGKGPARRAAVYFHQQDEDADPSYVRHAAIWGGERGFIHVERSHGIEIFDVAGYDTQNTGFKLFYDNSACGTRCTDRDAAPRDIVFTEVLAAKVRVQQRESGCLRIGHRHSAFTVSGDEGSGCRRCVVTGNAYEGSGKDVSAFQWAEGGSGRPMDFTFEQNVAHNNSGHGAFIWHNAAQSQAPYVDNRFWSNEGMGIHWGAYGQPYVMHDSLLVDNGDTSLGVKAVASDDRVRFDGLTVDDVRILSYVLAPDDPHVLSNLRFTGDSDVGISQVHDECSGGDEMDREDTDCAMIELVIENPDFASGVTPFDFGWTANYHSVWKVRGFSHPDGEYGDLPEDFDLYRRDNEVDGGRYDERFDAWLVPR